MTASTANHPIITDASEILSVTRSKLSSSDATSLAERAWSTFTRTIAAVDSPYTPVECGLLHVNATDGVVTVTLPDAATYPGFWLHIVKVDGGGSAVTIDRAGSDTIEGGTSLSLAAQYDKALVYIPSTGGTDWFQAI